MRPYDKEYVSKRGLELLKLAQEGNMVATEELLELIRRDIMPRRVGRYLGKNRQVDNDDLKQEFMIGVALAIGKADLELGDPIEYIVHRGLWRMRSYLRKFVVQNTFQYCHDCGYKSRINKIGHNLYQCKKCGSLHIDTTEVEDKDELTLMNITVPGFEEDLLSDLIIESFKNTLTPGTNIYNLFELLQDGIDRDNPMVTNYIKEIAKIWGGCSNENVVRNLYKLRERLERWIDQVKLNA